VGPSCQKDRPCCYRASFQEIGEQNFDTRKRGVHRHGAFTSSSSHTSACHPTSASPPAPLILLVVTFSGASASPSCRASTRRLGLHHSLCLNLSLHLSRLVGCHFAWCLNPALLLQLCPVPPLIASLLFGWFDALPSTLVYCTDACHVASCHCLLCIYPSHL